MRKPRSAETQIIAILKEANLGMKVKDVCRKHGISGGTFLRWRSQYGSRGGRHPSHELGALSESGLARSPVTARWRATRCDGCRWTGLSGRRRGHHAIGERGPGDAPVEPRRGPPRPEAGEKAPGYFNVFVSAAICALCSSSRSC